MAEGEAVGGEAEDSGGREEVLRRYADAGLDAYKSGDHADADRLYRAGIACGESFLAAGEQSPRVRERLLGLYFNAGVNAAMSGDRPAADRLHQAGLAHGESFLAAGESHRRMREQVLALYSNAGVNAAESGDRPAADRLYRAGLNQGETFLAAGESHPKVREQVLWLYFNAGTNATKSGERPAADRLFRTGIDYGETFLAAGESDPGVRERVLWLHFNAGVNAAESGDRPAADRLDRAGLDHGETFLAAGESYPGMREQVLKLHSKAGADHYNSGGVSEADRHTLLRFAASFWWGLPESRRGFAGLPEALARASAAWLEAEWPAFVDRWLLRYQGPAETIGDARQAHCLLRLHRAWWLDRQTTENGPTRARIEGALGLLGRLDDLGGRRDALGARVNRLAASLGLAGAAGADHPVADRPRTLPWWTRLRHFRNARQFEATRAGLTATDKPLAELRAEARRERRRQADWLGEAVGRHLAIPSQLDDLPGIVLGTLLDHQPDGAGSDLIDWSGDPADWPDAALAAGFEPTGWRDWISDGGGRALYGWARPRTTRPRLPHELTNRPEPDLEAAFRAAALGDWGPLRQFLTAAWASAQEPAGRLHTLLRALDGQGDRPWLNLMLDGPRTNPAPPDPADPGDLARWHRALLACLLGAGRTTLAEAIAERLERVCPLPPAGEARPLADAFGEGLGLCLSLHPGPQHRAAHAERIQGLAARLIALTLAKTPAVARRLAHWDGDQRQPGPEALEQMWDALEAARLALTGQTLGPRDRATVAETFEQIRDQIPATFGMDGVPPQLWPPLAYWLERTESALVRQPGPAACRAALGAGEAIAQVFFDETDGRLWLLWLHGAREPLCLALPGACGRARWRNAAKDGVLDRWDLALAAIEEDARPFDEDAWPAFHAGVPARTLSERLAALAHAEGIDRLVLLLPADLGQLPWETLPAFAPERLTIERAPSLDTWWRRASGEGLAAPAAQTRATAPRALAGDDDTLWFAEEELAAAGACLGGAAPLRRAGLVPLLRALIAPGGKHLLMHARYLPDNPWSSYFQVRRRRTWGDAAPFLLRAAADPTGVGAPADGPDGSPSGDALLAAWVAPVLGVSPDPIGLSACWAARYGAGLDGLSTSVGLGSSLLAGGARRVVGALWPCHQVASWLFYRTLYAQAAASPGTSWYRLVHEARETLRSTSAEALARLLKIEDRDFAVQSQLAGLDASRPSFWAGFVILGDSGFGRDAGPGPLSSAGPDGP